MRKLRIISKRRAKKLAETVPGYGLELHGLTFEGKPTDYYGWEMSIYRDDVVAVIAVKNHGKTELIDMVRP